MAAPTRLKRQLGAALRELREHAGMSMAQAAEELRADDSTVNRYELGQVFPTWPAVRTLLAAYGVNRAAIDRVTHIWEAAKDEAPPVRLPRGTPKAFRRYLTAEREACRERLIEPFVVTGLLQTERYARAVQARASRYHRPGGRTDGFVSIRLDRQKRLEFEASPLSLDLIMDEAVIRREVGGPDVMREQLAHLLVVAERPNITMRLVPYRVGAYGLMSGAVAIVDYSEHDETSGVYLEYPAGGAWVEDREDVEQFTTMFEDTGEAALTPTETVDLIHERMRE